MRRKRPQFEVQIPAEFAGLPHHMIAHCVGGNGYSVEWEEESTVTVDVPEGHDAVWPPGVDSVPVNERFVYMRYAKGDESKIVIRIGRVRHDGSPPPATRERDKSSAEMAAEGREWHLSRLD